MLKTKGLRNNRSISGWRQPTALWVLSALCLFLCASLPPQQALALARPAGTAPPSPPPAIGEIVSHLRCEPGYSATLYAGGLRSPDGLAFGPGGALYVVEERASRVSRIEPDGSTTPILSGLKSPEGIAFDDAGNLYVVEDVRKGRLLRRSPDGQVTTLADDLQAPEGVVALSAPGGGAAPAVYVTESNVQYVRHPYDLETGISAVASPGSVTRVITHTPSLRGATVAFWSYAGLTAGPDGRLYVTNELSGQEVNRQIEIIPDKLAFRATLFTEDSIFAIDPLRGTRTLVASGLLAPEGLRFSATGDYPLYVAEENVGSKGRLSRVERDGRRTTVCSSFRGIEDVIVAANGDLYVSEDLAGNVIRIELSDAARTEGYAPPQIEGSEAAGSATSPPGSASNPGARSPDGSSLFQGFWPRLATLARWIAGMLRSPRARAIWPTKAPSPLPDSATPPAPLASPQPGALVLVRATGGQGLRCRSAPGLDAEIVGRLAEGTATTLVDGPTQRDGYAWWQVELGDESLCWAAGNWLVPTND